MTENNYNILLESSSNCQKRKHENMDKTSVKIQKNDSTNNQKEKNFLKLLESWFAPELEKENYPDREINLDINNKISQRPNKQQLNNLETPIIKEIQQIPELRKVNKTDDETLRTTNYTSCSQNTLQKDDTILYENIPENSVSLSPINYNSSINKFMDKPEIVKFDNKLSLETYKHKIQDQIQTGVPLKVSRWIQDLDAKENNYIGTKTLHKNVVSTFNQSKTAEIAKSLSKSDTKDTFGKTRPEDHTVQQTINSPPSAPEDIGYSKNMERSRKMLNLSVGSIASLGISKLTKRLKLEKNNDLDLNKNKSILSTNNIPKTPQITASTSEKRMKNIFENETKKQQIYSNIEAQPTNCILIVDPTKELPEETDSQNVNNKNKEKLKKLQDPDFSVTSDTSFGIGSLIRCLDLDNNYDLDQTNFENTMSTCEKPLIVESFLEYSTNETFLEAAENPTVQQAYTGTSFGTTNITTACKNSIHNLQHIENPKPKTSNHQVVCNKNKKNLHKTTEYFDQNNITCSQTSYTSVSGSSAIVCNSNKKNYPNTAVTTDCFEENNIECSQTSHISLSSNFDVSQSHVLSILSTNISLFPNGLRKFQNIHRLSANLNWLSSTLPIIEANNKRSLRQRVYPIFDSSPLILTEKSTKFHTKLPHSQELSPVEKILEDKIDQNINKPLLQHHFCTPPRVLKEKIIQNIHFILGQFYDIFQNGGFACIQSWNLGCRNSVFKNRMYMLKPKSELIIRTTWSPKIICCILFLLSKVCVLLETKKKITVRELFYLLKCIFKRIHAVSNAVDELSRLLGVGPWHLNICTHNGLVYGDLKLIEGATVTTCSTSPVIIPLSIDEITEVESSAHFILVVEKEAIFMKLIEENLLSKLGRPFIILTGKGVPSYNTRLFLHKLAEMMQIPVFILTDPDVYGIKIMMTYRFGCFRSCHLSQYLTVPNAQWLGILPSEINSFGLPRLKITQREKNVLNKLMKDYHELESEYPQLFKEFNIILRTEVKASIEGMIKSDNFLSQVYLPTKLIQDNFF